MRLCALSIDLDSIGEYHRIHGLVPPVPPARDAVYDVALGRFEEFAESEGVPLTLFAVGRDLSRPESAAALRRLVDKGHAVENHTLDHPYDLTRFGRQGLVHQVAGGIAAIEAATGRKPAGFRAPGYTVSGELFEVLDELGVAYDSSVFPCPAYYAAKAATLGLMRLRGRHSSSVLDTPAVLLAPTRPYRIGVPYWVKGAGPLELPVQVTPGLRLPFIGTSLVMAGRRGAELLARSVIGEPLVNLELHGIDALDEFDGLSALRSVQPDVTLPFDSKLGALRAVVSVLRGAGYSFVRLSEAAALASDGRS
jgi:hypothetical protein